MQEPTPELLGLANEDTFVLIEKKRFGPVLAWRAVFVEPEGIWLPGTNHISSHSAEGGRVVRGIKPDKVVAELCRSWKVFLSFFFGYFDSNVSKLWIFLMG